MGVGATALLLVRHASTEPSPDLPGALWPLTEQGRRDAARLVGALPSVTTVYASPEPKAVATATPLAEARGLRLEILHGLRELERPWTGEQRAYEAAVARCFAEPRTSAAAGWETAAVALARFQAAIADACAAGGGAAVVSHGLVLSLYRARLLGLPVADLGAWRAMPFPAWAVADVDRAQLLQDFQGL